MITSINPAILKWARERAGLSLEDLAIAMKRDPDELRMWENGQKSLSYTPYSGLKTKSSIVADS